MSEALSHSVSDTSTLNKQTLVL
uniref:Uncharacterized protein n=1 Tax=Anguilla anguilla TaxID=7936 RepID=A0A0E9U3I1_ANGAN